MDFERAVLGRTAFLRNSMEGYAIMEGRMVIHAEFEKIHEKFPKKS